MPGTIHNTLSNSRSNASPEDDLEESMRHLKIENDERGGEDADGDPKPYPFRPGEPNCKFYIRTGSCSFGSKCKYNHPTLTEQETQQRAHLPQTQRDGQPDCQFFLKTGTCKYGTSCRYHHPRDKHQSLQFNVLGLPMRKDAKSCPFFMKTGSCKFSVACKFNHPQPANVAAIFPASGASVYEYTGSSAATGGQYLIGGISTWPPWTTYMSSPHMQAFPSYMPLALPPNQATVLKQQGSSTDMVKRGNTSVPSTNALGPNHIPNSNHQAEPGSSMAGTFPERPDQPECQYYMKTGRCKYGSSCKYHHPTERNQATDCTIGPFGLPLRPGSPTCTFYAINGSCKYGAACKFDHPIVAVFALQEPSTSFSYQNGPGYALMTSEKPSFRIPNAPDGLKTSVRISELRDFHDKEHENASAPTSTHTTRYSAPSVDQSYEF